MISRLRNFSRSCKDLQAMLAMLLCLSLLVCVLVQEARVVNPSMRGYSREMQYYQDQDTLLIGSWQFASAHSNVGALQLNRQRMVDIIHENGLLLVARYATPTLALILPLLALFTGLALVRANPALHVFRSVRSWALCVGLLSLAVPIVVGLFLILESRSLEIPFSWSQWSRLLVWLGFVGTYFATFLVLGTWISHHVRHVRTAVWIFASLLVAMFMIQSGRELIVRFDGSHLPPVPELPVEVRLSLFRPSGEPRVTRDRETMVATYLESVDAYSNSVHAVVEHRYGLERWWHVVSPQLLLYELSYQLLQAQLADIVDVVYALENEGKEPSMMSSLTSVWPEMVWLILLCGFSGLGAGITARKQASAP